VPVVYFNDNFGRWQSDWRKVVAACLADDSPGRAVAERLRPRDGDLFVLKPMHSGFHGTPLDELLRRRDSRAARARARHVPRRAAGRRAAVHAAPGHVACRSDVPT
jgi:nicotinamidase-related amidase